MSDLYVVYTYESLPDGSLACQILSGEPDRATWTLSEAQVELAALKQKNPSLNGMTLQIEAVAS